MIALFRRDDRPVGAQLRCAMIARQSRAPTRGWLASSGAMIVLCRSAAALRDDRPAEPGSYKGMVGLWERSCAARSPGGAGLLQGDDRPAEPGSYKGMILLVVSPPVARDNFASGR